MEREVGTRQLNYKITDEKKIIEKELHEHCLSNVIRS